MTEERVGKEEVKKFKEYVRTYDAPKHPFFLLKISYIRDMIYGIGISIDPEKYYGAEGYRRWIEDMKEYL